MKAIAPMPLGTIITCLNATQLGASIVIKVQTISAEKKSFIPE